MNSDDPALQDLLARIIDGLTGKVLGNAGVLAPVFLISALAIAAAIWWRRKPGQGFFRWAFPREIWFHPSHRTDIKVFLFGGLLSLVATGAGIVSAAKIGAALSSALDARIGLGPETPLLTSPVMVTVVVFLVLDFCQYWAHRLSHDWAVLWPFHATHHSAEVLTPITVYRRHPVDDLVLQVVTWIVTGVVLGLVLGLSIGPVPTAMLGGLSGTYYVFNLAGANLRHSHVWLSFGPVLEHIIISPAQHQVHHSCDPRHHNRNYGQILAIWDWMFGTLCVPRGREDLTFGLSDGQGNLVPQPHGSLGRFLVEPFRGSARVMRRWLGRRKDPSGQEQE